MGDFARPILRELALFICMKLPDLSTLIVGQSVLILGTNESIFEVALRGSDHGVIHDSGFGD